MHACRDILSGTKNVHPLTLSACFIFVFDFLFCQRMKDHQVSKKQKTKESRYAVYLLMYFCFLINIVILNLTLVRGPMKNSVGTEHERVHRNLALSSEGMLIHACFTQYASIISDKHTITHFK